MYDVAIIGAGPGGISCAKEAHSLGLEAILIDKNKESFGGTCLNSGCIPAKFLLNSSKHNTSWDELIAQKGAVVDGIKTSLLKHLENQKIKVQWGSALLLDNHTINIDGQKVEAKNIVIATGSSPKSLVQEPKIVFAQDLLNEQSLEDKFLIIGAGYIGVELASLLNNLGKDVLLIEKENRILPFADLSLAKRLRIILEKKGIKIKTGDDVSNYNLDDFDTVISAVGRIPNAVNLGLEGLGVHLEDGWIKTDEFLRTNVSNIYACGDVTGKKLLAYTAEYQGRICAQNIAAKPCREDLENIPECVFSVPQLAQLGLSSDEAAKLNIPHRVIKSNFLRFSSSYAYNDTDGFIQVIVGEDDKILGAGIISNFAADLANTLSLCIRNKLGIKELREAVLIHPTISEIISLLMQQ